MKTLAALALLLVLGGSSVRAQQVQPAPPADDRRAQLELLELEQEVDKTLLREALLLLGRKGLRPLSERPTAEGAKHREEADLVNLAESIESRKEAIMRRSAEMNKLRGVPNRVATSQPNPPNRQPVPQESQALIARYAEAQVEAQLLQRKSELFQQSLNEAVEALANAELAASTDEEKQKDVEAAAKQYEKAKARYVEINKKFLAVQNDIFNMQQQGVIPGMGGMGGMGGGFR